MEFQGLDDVQSKREWIFFKMMSFLNQADSYEEGLEGTSSFVNQNSDDEQKTEDDNTSLEFDGHEEQSVSELPDLTTPEQNLEENPNRPPSAGNLLYNFDMSDLF